MNIHLLRTLQIIYYGRIDLSEGTDVNKNKDRNECIVYRYYYFDKGFKFQRPACNGFHDILMISLGIKNIATITVKGIDYCCITCNFSKSDLVIC